MGSQLNKLKWGGDPDVQDSRTGLSRRDIYTIRKTWAPVNAKAGAYGMELLLRLFRKDPSTQNFFHIIQGMSEEEIVKKAEFKAHIKKLMTSLNTAVHNLKHPETVVTLTHRLGGVHHSKKVEVKHFEKLKEVLVDFLVNDLKLNQSEMVSWGRFVEFVFGHIYEALK